MSNQHAAKNRPKHAPLYRLVYVSQISYLALFDPRLFEKITFSALKNNLKRNLTGILCFGDGYFMQYIEGSEQDLTNLKNILLQDNRHHSFQLCDFSPIEERLFPNHHRGFVVIDKRHQLSDSLLREFVPFNPSNLNNKGNPKLLAMDGKMALIELIREHELMEDEFNLSWWDLIALRIRLAFQLFSDSVSRNQLIFIFEICLFIFAWIALVMMALCF